MFRNRLVELKIGVAAGVVLALLMFVVGCGDGGDQGVRARNLLTGEIQDFPSEADVPPDWVTCSTPDCPIPPTVPCDYLSEKVCTLNPNCRLKVLWCQGGGVVPTDPPGTTPGGEPQTDSDTNTDGSEPGGSGTTPPQPPPPPGTTPPLDPNCKYQCIPKLPLLCEELTDATQCKARTDCDWGQVMCPAIACQPGQPCPPCPFSCYTKGPPICQQLDENQCNARSDCQWDTLACDMMCRDDGKGGCLPCNPQGICNPKTPVPPPCPTIPAPPPDYCKNGKIVQDYDAAGCVVGYHCEMPQDCWDLNKAYINAVKEAKACNPYAMTPVDQCSKQVQNALFCPVCPTFINPANTAAVSKMAAAAAKWKALSCDMMEMVCPAMACPTPQSATCLPGSAGTSTGSCVDDQPTP